MIININDNQYINVDAIDALRQMDTPAGNGIAVIGGQKISLTKAEFEILQKAYLWLRGETIYKLNDKGEFIKCR